MNIDSSIVYSVSQLNNLAKSYLERNCSRVVVKGEISSLKKYPSGFVYITIKDINSEINCVIFPDIGNISELEVGYEFSFIGKLSIYTPKGNYQLIINSFKKNDVGNLWEKYTHLKNKLDKEGLFAKELKRKIPSFPFNIGIISSLEGAVIHDMEKIFNRRSPHILMHINPVRVQGKGADIEISKAINYFNMKMNVDLLIIARGGGSFEDLDCFNSETLARSISSSEIPVVTAIGHETDFTIADFVSDLRASTPSVAAELVTQSSDNILIEIENLADKIFNSVSSKIENYFYQYRIMKNNLKFDNLILITDKILDAKKHLDKILVYTVNNRLSYLENELKSNKKRIHNNNLDRILHKGFALVLNTKGNIVKSVEDVNLEDKIVVKLNDGKIGAEIIEKE